MAEQQQEREWTEEEIEKAMWEAEGEEPEPEPESGDTGRAEQEGSGEDPGEQQPFRFSDEQQSEPESDDSGQPESQGEDYVEIVHRGQVHRVTKDKAKELAQKGFDYDVKVGPHQRIAQLIQSDPELAEKVDKHVKAKMQGQQPPGEQQGQGQGQQPAQDPADLEVEPAEKFDSDEEWLKANMRKAQQAIIQQMQQQQAAQPQPQPQQGGMTQVQQVQQMLLAHDPQGYQQVAPHLKDFAEKNLTKQQFDRVNSDPQALLEFYQWVRPRVLGQQQGPQQGAPQARGGEEGRRKKQPSFRAQSGGGQPDRGKSEADRIWDMPNDQFWQEFEKIKGFSD